MGEEGRLSAFTVMTGTAELSSSGSSSKRACRSGDKESAERALGWVSSAQTMESLTTYEIFAKTLSRSQALMQSTVLNELSTSSADGSGGSSAA